MNPTQKWTIYQKKKESLPVLAQPASKCPVSTLALESKSPLASLALEKMGTTLSMDEIRFIQAADVLVSKPLVIKSIQGWIYDGHKPVYVGRLS